ncbi:MAG: leucine-rich repeat domain-containing protein [Clostridiales bacterium]|nr:leucine-rich repeat domain-containing protein [Clostridiales bacterium]MDY4654792.1 leucine-rich repeat domain-containing protein [Eubacteriales bacterium]
MKKRVFQIVTLAVFVILLSVTLCACSLLGSGSKDKDKDGNVDKKLSGIFPTTETPKWSSASGEIFEYREDSDEESGGQKIIVTGLKKKTEKQVVIPDGVNEIAENAFTGCNNIISLVISDTVTSIGRAAFYECTGLIGVSVGKNVSNIGDEAFGGCYKLVEVYNKSSLDIMARSGDNGNIGYYAKNVYDKADLTRLDVDDNNYISYIDGDKKTLMGYSGTQTELALPDGVTDIYHYAFAFNGSVKKVTMSKDVIMTGDGVFTGCTALKYVEFSGKIKKISRGAFYGCTALNGIAIPETVTSVGEYAFALCTSLTRVIVGTNVKKIEEAAFYNCYKLVEVYNKSSLDIKAAAASDNEPSSAVGDNVGYGDIGKYVKYVYKESGKSRLATDEKGFVVYADGINKILVNYIGEETAPTLPSEVTEINDYAFYDCDKITEIKIPSGVTSIGKSAFLGCDELTEVTIPAETTSIGRDGILRDCPKLAKVSLPTSAIKALNGARVKKVVVTSGETIPEMAFSGLKEMTEIILPAGLKVIGDGAFYGCTGLTDVIIPDTVMVIGSAAFAGCEGMKALYYKGTAEQWNKITVSGEIGTEAKRYFYSETAPTKEGNYWRYFDGKVFVWETVHIHSFGEWTEKTPATCVTDKVERRECLSCGVEQTRTVEKTALGHE